MSSIEPYRGSGRALGRQLNRELAKLEGGTNLAVARIEAAAEVQSARVDAVAFVGRRAMQDVALLSQVESQLAQAVPHASGRLASIADLTAIAMTEVVVDTARRVGR